MSLRIHGNGCHVEKLNGGEASFDGPSEEVRLRVYGMGCVNCATRVHNGLITADGVLLARVDLARATAVVRIDPARIRPEQLLERVAAAGAASNHRYAASVLQPS